MKPALPRLKVLGDGSGPRLKLAKAWFDKEEYARAWAEAQAAIRSDPDLYLAHFLLAEIAVRQGEDFEAHARYRETLKLNPRFALGHQRLGDLLLQWGRHPEAMAAYLTSLRIDGSVALVRAKLGALYFELRDFRRATVEYRKAGRLDPAFVRGGHSVGDFHGLMKSLLRRRAPVPQAPRSA